MPNAAVLGDQLEGNIISGTITSCRYASEVYHVEYGPIAFVGDEVTATGYVGPTIQTHTGQITTGKDRYTKNGSAIAVVGESQWVAGPFSGVIRGPGAPDVITT